MILRGCTTDEIYTPLIDAVLVAFVYSAALVTLPMFLIL